MVRLEMFPCVVIILLLQLASGDIQESSDEQEVVLKRYDPTWKSLDSRPLPSWYDKVKIGVIITWGVYSVPSFATGTGASDGSEWFWENWKQGNKTPYVDFMKRNYNPSFTYADFAPKFTAELWNPDQWAELIHKSGAKYVVLTAKHHDGFTLWPSKYAFSWNAMDVGPRKDLVGELAQAVRTYDDIHFGLYHSLFEWFNPLYLNDRANNRSDFVALKTLPELYEIVKAYKPDVIWSDGDWNDSPEYWNSTEFLAWLYNDSPVKDTVAVNDRWGNGTKCKHGGFFNCGDRFSPGVLQHHKWENTFTLDTGSWGLRRNAVLEDYMTPEGMIAEVVRTVSCRGNVLINIAPASDGTIHPIYEERLTQLGEWLDVNGEAIYNSSPWVVQNDTETPDVWYTSRFELVYAIVLNWPENGRVKLGSAPDQIICEIVGYGPVSCLDKEVVFPPLEKVTTQWAWVIKLIPA